MLCCRENNWIIVLDNVAYFFLKYKKKIKKIGNICLFVNVWGGMKNAVSSDEMRFISSMIILLNIRLKMVDIYIYFNIIKLSRFTFVRISVFRLKTCSTKINSIKYTGIQEHGDCWKDRLWRVYGEILFSKEIRETKAGLQFMKLPLKWKNAHLEQEMNEH